MIAYVVTTGSYEDEVIDTIFLSESAALKYYTAKLRNQEEVSMYTHVIMDKPDKPTYFAVQYDNEVYGVFDNQEEANEFKAGCYGLKERHIKVVKHTWGE